LKLDSFPPSAHRVELDTGVSVYGGTVVIASGARYRRPDIKDLDRFEGASVSYWATPIEARICEGRGIVLVGGGNSVGQAAAFLSSFARKIRLIVRAASLDASMSHYLIERIMSTPNVELHTTTTVTGLTGTHAGALEQVHLACETTGKTWQIDAQYMFLFIGAEPNTQWLGHHVSLVGKGFVTTGYSSTA